MKNTSLRQTEFFYQIIALALVFVIIHSIYIVLIRPNAEIAIQQQLQLQEQGTGISAERSIWVVLKDYEQEACFVLMFWALAIMWLKLHRVQTENKLLDKKLLPLAEGEKILNTDANKLARQLSQPPLSQYLLTRALSNGLQRFSVQGTIQEVATAVRDACEIEAQRLDSELSMIRYIAWAIPSIGFIGTVRGIGEALGNAHLAVNGDIVSVTSSLGVAFNSTFIALVISIFLMFFSHQLTLMQERLVHSCQQYCEDYLITNLQR